MNVQLSFTFTRSVDEQLTDAIEALLGQDTDLLAAASNWTNRRANGDLHPADIRWMRKSAKQLDGYEYLNEVLGGEMLDAVAEEVMRQSR